MFKIEYNHPKATADHLGYIPNIITDTDPRPVAEQVNERYSYGGGWNPTTTGWHVLPKVDLYGEPAQNVQIRYPGDPSLKALFSFRINAERVFIFDSAWVMVVQPDGSYEIARMD